MNNQSISEYSKRDIYSVSRLNSEVRAVLEGGFPLLWVEGEISNLARPASGHIYFSLKDSQAQTRCAMFRMKRQRLRFQPENGLQVLIRARVSLYEGRGEFQLIVEHMEPAGEGALRQSFEALKQRLASEGLFDRDLKKPLPPFPERIGIITSPSGAAVRDVLTVLKRRLPSIPVMIYPVPVQGDGAAAAIEQMIYLADRRQECDLLILTRGGGSLEDLMAFNDEGVARAIHGAAIPIISAVGHEIDFTIADFVADQRAATPSAAAEMASPSRDDLSQNITTLARRLELQIRQRMQRKTTQLSNLRQRLLQQHPGSRLMQWQQRLDELEQRLTLHIRHQQRRRVDRLSTLMARIQARTPLRTLERVEQRQALLRQRLHHAFENGLHCRQQQLAATVANLQALSPLATLERGYSITRRLPRGEVLQDAASVSPDDQVEVLLARGSLVCRIESMQEEPA